VGIPAAGQSMVGKDDLVGHCVNLLPVRSRPTPAQRFSDYAKGLQAVMLDAYEHQQVTFGWLLKKLHAQRDPSRIPLVSVVFNIDTGIDLDGMKFGELDVDFRANPRAFENFEVFLNISPTKGGQFVFELTHNCRLFDAETARGWLNQLNMLLQGIVDDPDRTLAELPLLNAQEQLEVLQRWNPPPTEFPHDRCVHELVAEQSARTPDAPAVRGADGALTYRELDNSAALVAEHLARLHVGRGALVGILVERSVQMVAAVLGVLKAGAAYVPLDPSFPKDRLKAMVDDAACAAILTSGALAPLIHAENACAVQLEEVWSARGPVERPSGGTPARPDDLAYVIYTSGSTGKPKGVEVSHRAVVNLLHSMAREPGIKASDVFLAVTTLSFDIAGLELFLPLITGAQTVIASREVASDGKKLANALQANGASLMQGTPTTWRLLLEAGWRAAPGFKALCGGEALTRELADAIMTAGAELWNLYGPTETTIWSAVSKVERGETAPPLGHPVDNTQLFILDPTLKPVPVGVPGELFIGGEGLARGYRGRKDLTAERFIEGSVQGRGSGRLYRTGDLARRSWDGSLHFLGRADSQVKLRGYRIELGEIETHLSQHTAIRQAVVLIREDVPGSKGLVAYYTCKPNCNSGAEDLRSYLKERLPAYMVPSLFVALDRLPLTPNGKVDRKALPRPGALEDGQHRHVPPRNRAEQNLASIWKRLLGVPQVSATASFFDLGGDSLLAARLFAELERSTGKAVPLATLFESPTLEGLAKALEATASTGRWSSLVPIQPRGTKPPLFLVHGAEGNVLLYRELVACLNQEQPVYGLQSQGLDGSSAPDTSIEGMASRYVVEILRHDPHGPYYLGGYCMGGAVALEIAQQLRLAGKEVRLVAMLETYNVQASSHRAPFLLNLLNGGENIVFHLANMVAAARSGNAAFLKSKYTVQKRRIGVRINILLSTVKAAAGCTDAIKYHHRRTDRINDAAHEFYKPQKYPGCIVVFRPKVNYAGYRDPLFGWGGIAEGGVEVHALPVFPRGMLVRPYVQELAQELEKILLERQGR